MSRLFTIGFAFASMAGFFATQGFAQSSPCCCSNGVVVSSPVASTVQTYQRYSYQPSSAPMTQMAQPAVVAVPQSSNVVYAAPQTQSYRRFSYQPSGATSTRSMSTRKDAWEYSKTDPRRYQN